MVEQEAKNEKRRFLCNECGFKSFNKCYMNTHMKRHNKDPKEQTHTCSHCDYASDLRQNLVRHIRVKHGIVIPTVKREKKWAGIMKIFTSTVILNLSFLV